MRQIRTLSVLTGVLAVGLAFFAGYAAGQRQPPTQTVGQSEELLRTIDLSNELDSTKGRPLRMRKITVKPGGVLGLHNHVDRPAITYMLQGQMTYHQDQGLGSILHSNELPSIFGQTVYRILRTCIP